MYTNEEMDSFDMEDLMVLNKQELCQFIAAYRERLKLRAPDPQDFISDLYR